MAQALLATSAFFTATRMTDALQVPEFIHNQYSEAARSARRPVFSPARPGFWETCRSHEYPGRRAGSRHMPSD